VKEITAEKKHGREFRQPNLIKSVVAQTRKEDILQDIILRMPPADLSRSHR
jgi:hypothetical protein